MSKLEGFRDASRGGLPGLYLVAPMALASLLGCQEPKPTTVQPDDVKSPASAASAAAAPAAPLPSAKPEEVAVATATATASATLIATASASTTAAKPDAPVKSATATPRELICGSRFPPCPAGMSCSSPSHGVCR